MEYDKSTRHLIGGNIPLMDFIEVGIMSKDYFNCNILITQASINLMTRSTSCLRCALKPHVIYYLSANGLQKQL